MSYIFLVVDVPPSKSTTKNIVFCVLADGLDKKFNEVMNAKLTIIKGGSLLKSVPKNE